MFNLSVDSQGQPGERGLPGEAGKEGPPVSYILDYSS